MTDHIINTLIKEIRLPAVASAAAGLVANHYDHLSLSDGHVAAIITGGVLFGMHFFIDLAGKLNLTITSKNTGPKV